MEITAAELITKIKELDRIVKANGKEVLEEIFTDFFKKHQEVSALVWRQISPNDRDGDASDFTVTDPELYVYPSKLAQDVQVMGEFDDELLEDEDTEEEEDEDDEYSDFKVPGKEFKVSVLEDLPAVQEGWRGSYNKVVKFGLTHRPLTEAEQSLVADFEDLNETMQVIDQVLRQVLGESIRVLATRDGFQTEEENYY